MYNDPIFKNWYVKFVPLNKYTYSNLINKTIRFSSIYDFNEESVFIAKTKVKQKILENPETTKCLKEYLDKKTNILKLIEVSSKSTTFTNHYKKQFIEAIDIKSLEELILGYYDIIIESIAYLETGIFCLSHITTFESDHAQLMFAHYAQNLEGLALIYKYEGDNNNIHEVTYKSEISTFDSRSRKEDFSNLLQGDEKESFLTKSAFY